MSFILRYLATMVTTSVVLYLSKAVGYSNTSGFLIALFLAVVIAVSNIYYAEAVDFDEEG